MSGLAIKAAIETGDAAALAGLLAKDPALANRMIQWGDAGKNSAHLLHYVSDMLFDGTLALGK